MIGNKSCVNGSICEAYSMKEATYLFTHYFDPQVMTRRQWVARNDDGGILEDDDGSLSIFTHPVRLSGEPKRRDFSLKEVHAAQSYIFLNCPEVEPFVRLVR